MTEMTEDFLKGKSHHECKWLKRKVLIKALIKLPKYKVTWIKLFTLLVNWTSAKKTKQNKKKAKLSTEFSAM